MALPSPRRILEATRAGPGVDQSERQLLERFLACGEEGAFATLLERHGPMVLSVCRRVLGDAHEAKDAFQATFLILARRAHSVRKRESLS
ncbi:MAG TPA: sigma factor [Gemmataceae bacterium]|nr:sigma factor [Gemmataceae bacterium]